MEWDVNPSPAKVENGRKLVLTLGACGSCHGLKPSPESPLGGGREVVDVYGDVHAANLTPSTSGLANWDLADFLKAIREDRGRDGEHLSVEFHEGLKWAANRDLADMFAYLMSLQAIDNEVERRDLGFWERNITGALESRYDVDGYVPQPDLSSPVQRGQYLVDHVANCGRCHTMPAGLFSDSDYLGGGKLIEIGEEEKFAPSLQPDPFLGIGAWSKKDLVNYLRTGKTVEGIFVDKSFCPIEFYQMAEQEDLEAIAAYLKSL